MTLDEYKTKLKETVANLKKQTHGFDEWGGAYMDGKEYAFETVLEELEEVT